MAAAFGSLLLLAGCGGVARQVDTRMQNGLAPQVAARQATVQRLPDGTQVTLAEDALFAPGSAVLTGQGQLILASVIEGLMAPPLMHIEVAASPPAAAGLQQARVAAVRQFFTDFMLGPQLQATVSAPAAAAPQSLAITVHVRRS